MKTIIIFSVFVLAVSILNAQDYLINFTGSGASSTIDSVRVKNLNQGTGLTINGTDVLHLFGTTGINSYIKANESIFIFPNPMKESAIFEFYSEKPTSVVIEIFDVIGKTEVQRSHAIQHGKNVFEITGLHSGFYTIVLNTDENRYAKNLIVINEFKGSPSVQFSYSVQNETLPKLKKGTRNLMEMPYNEYETLLFTAYSGTFATVSTLIPTIYQTVNQTVNSIFAPCTDYNGNNYSIVRIGNQTWMAENLKSTSYNDGTAIPLVTNSTSWGSLTTNAYCWYSNNQALNGNTYGALYNWHTVNNGNLCPLGWHVPTENEYIELDLFLMVNGFNYDSTISYNHNDASTNNNVAKSLASTTNWSISNDQGVIGNTDYPTHRNITGFSALPGGSRSGMNGTYADIGNRAFFWTATQHNSSYSKFRYLFYNSIGSGCCGAYDDKGLGYSVRCIKNDTVVKLNTTGISDITQTTAISGGNITSTGGAVIISRGVCWSTIPNPTILDNITIDGNGAGNFTSLLTGLSYNTTYYVRSYATTSEQTAYGNQISFTVLTYPNCGTVTDVDGNIYQTVTIGTQCWMQKNLKTTKFKNGDDIPMVSSNITWQFLTTPARCWNFNDSATYYNSAYGSFYNWFAVNTGNLCPDGWHVPTEADWTNLINYFGDETKAGGKLKEAGFANWNYPNSDATNEKGFTLLPGGYRSLDGTFYNYTRNNSQLWSSSQGTIYPSMAIGVNATCVYGSLYLGEGTKTAGLYVRCVSDTTLQALLVPVLTTTGASLITPTTAVSGGDITSDGGSAITARGVCWSRHIHPTIADSKTIDGAGTGSFTSNLIGLMPDSTYYYRAYATNSIGTAYGTEKSFVAKYTIGSPYLGGIIAYILQSYDSGYIAGEIHGIIAAPSDQSTGIEWGCNGTYISGASSSTAGATNTTAILAGCTTRPIAASICDSLTLNGYNDWYLPAKNQLNYLYNQAAVIGNFTTNNYWTSTEYSSNSAYIKAFDGNYNDLSLKNSLKYVRCIKTF